MKISIYLLNTFVELMRKLVFRMDVKTKLSERTDLYEQKKEW